MKLHPPDLAQRRATAIETPGHCPRCLRLSVTLGTLPAHVPYLPYEHTPSHLVIIARDGITYDELALSYARDLPAWARKRIFGPLGVIDPGVDLVGYFLTRWWGPDWPLTTDALVALETAAADLGCIHPWPHEWLLGQPA